MSSSSQPPDEGAPRAAALPAGVKRATESASTAQPGLGDVVARLQGIEAQLATQRVADEHRERAIEDLRAERDALAEKLEQAQSEHAALVRGLVAARRAVQVAESKGMHSTDQKFAKVVTAAEHLLAFADEVESRLTRRTSGLLGAIAQYRDATRSLRILRSFWDPASGAIDPKRLFYARIRRHGFRGAIERLDRDLTNTLLHRERTGHTIDWLASRSLTYHHRRRLLQRLRDRAHELASLVRTTLRPALATITAALPTPTLHDGVTRHRPAQATVGRVVVYTAVVDGYDALHDPAMVPPGWDFVAFSDRAIESDVWNVRPLNYVERDPSRSARFVKLHPHLYFPDYEFSIWLDANITPIDDLSGLVAALGARDFIGMFHHPHRDCVYVEAEACLARGKDVHANIGGQTSRYREEGFPPHYGLWETGVLVRRHREDACVRLMVAWWNEIFTGSRRDQISFPYVARQHHVSVAELGPPGTDLRAHPLLAYENHQTPDEAVPQTEGSEHATPSPPAGMRVSIDASRFAVDIVICVHDAPKSVEGCLSAVASARRPGDRIVLVDDGSAQETRTMLEDFARRHAAVVLIRNDDNRGYTRSANAGIVETTAPYVVLLNSDTRVARDTFDKLVACGEQAARIGIVGPLSNAAGWQTVPVLRSAARGFHINELPAGYSVDDMERLIESVDDGGLPVVPLINGFCFAIKRQVLEDVGLFDEVTFPVGYGEEDDFCLRAVDAGYVCAIATDAYVFHEKSASFTAERRKVLARQGGASLRAKHTAERVDRSAAVVEHHPELARIRAAMLSRLEGQTPGST